MKQQESIGRQVATLRRKLGLSQEVLAARIDVTQNYVCQIETGRKFPSFTVIGKLASALGVSVSTLVEDDPITADLRRLVDENGLEAVLATVSQLLDPYAAPRSRPSRPQRGRPAIAAGPRKTQRS